MLERQDIDALLIGALYGELTPADEARLSAHLDSHPADKSALADLTSARSAIRESRFLTVQIEPPQAISALLLQEASRSAPARAVAAEPPKESWFYRFIHSFARHPAMAAAAMLVVVVGVAGTMYLRNGGKDQFAEQTARTFERDQAPATGAPAAPAAEPSINAVDEAKLLQDHAGSAFGATLAEGAAQEEAKPADAKATATAKAERARVDEQGAKKAAPNRTYIGVQTERPQPKELEQQAPRDFGGASFDGDASRRAAKGGSTTTTTRTPPPAVVIDSRNEKRDTIATPAPPPPPRAPQAAPRGAGGAPGAIGGEDALKDKSIDNEETTWAREQHTRVTNAVKAKNCKDATAFAIALSNRAPAYYTQNVENDRDLKLCMTYINAEREKVDAQKQRALQKRNAEEPKRASPPTTNSTK